ncbi:MAG: Stp1/IreP family PP2C-type Ser/Thr phosphatase [Deltaproteobacteria bacterium]|nr:MAG: Stp1/IreP family PP2C-type Ser/Thr phosphatase [Deltaproteobacteria bacterium]
MRIRFAGLTDVGRSRTNNEDAFHISRVAPLCAVADGMGGHNAGEVASDLALRTLRAIYDESPDDQEVATLMATLRDGWPFERRAPEHDEERRLVEALVKANAVIHAIAQRESSHRGMGTTMVAASFIETGIYLAHVGDSRAYRLRDGRLERITRDHSLADEYLQMGILREDELPQFPYKNVITRALGLAPVIEPAVRFTSLQRGDLFLLCTDGLTDPLDEATIARVVSGDRSDLNEMCRRLVDAANAAGGPDNITVVVASVVER